MSGGPTDPTLVGLPYIPITGYSNLACGPSMPVSYTVNSFDTSDTMTWVRGAHLLKFGVDILHTQDNDVNANNSRGTYNFTGSWTGLAYADFLLGYLNSDSIAVGTVRSYLRDTATGASFQDDWKVSSRLTLNLGARYDLLQPVHDKYGRWTNFIPGLNKEVVASFAGAPPGAGFTNSSSVETAQQAGLPSSLAYTNYKNLAPRFGFAWRPWGGNQTVLRGGYGIFYGTHEQVDARTLLADVFPFAISESLSRNTGNPNYLTLSNPFPVAPTLTSNVLSVTGYQLHAPTPYLQSWNLTLERDLGHQSAVEIGYQGTRGTHWPREININQSLLSAATYPNYPVPYPQWSTIAYWAFWGNSVYNAGSVTFRRRFADNFFYRASYTYGKSLDEGSMFQGNIGVQDSLDLRGERGRSDFDIRHSFTMSFSWQAPRQYNIFLRGWQLAGTGVARTGSPFTPYLSNEGRIASGTAATRPDRIRNGSVPNRSPNQWYDVTAFPQVSHPWLFGNSGRNILDAPGSIGINLSFSRNFAVRERSNLQFRCETFNVLNHANFGFPIMTVTATNAATITSAGNPRQMQAALKFTF